MGQTEQNRLVLFLGIALLMLPTFTFASDAPVVIGKFIQYSTDLIGGKVGVLIIALIIIISAVLAWKNASYTPLIYGLIAATLVGAAVNIGGSFTDFNLSGYGE